MSLEVERLSFSYGAHPVLEEVSFTVLSGKLLAVLGPNGVGKTTLFRCILGLQRRYAGRITVDGTDAGTLPARELAHRIAYIPQVHGSAFSYSVMDMVLMGTSHSVAPLSVPGAKQSREALQALERLGIEQLAKKSYSRLSGGEQQLVLIARALAQSARTLLMDEPTASLDYGNQARVMKEVRSLADEGYTVVLSTHDPQQAIWYADEALALLGSRAEAFGSAREILTPGLIERLYGVSIKLIETEYGTVIAPCRGGCG